MKNVLFVASRTNIAGGEIYLLDVFRHLDRSRFKPIVVVPGEGPFSAKLAELDIEYFVSESNYGWLKPPVAWYRFLDELPSRVRRLAQEMADRGIDLVHTNSNQILEGALAAKLAGIHPQLRHQTVKMTAKPEKVHIFANGTSLLYR